MSNRDAKPNLSIEELNEARKRSGNLGGGPGTPPWLRALEWAPAVEAAGLYQCCGRTMKSTRRTGSGIYRCSRCKSEWPSRRIYDLRHTFATNALAAGIAIFELARYMGTSVATIDRTYGHLAQGSEDLARARLDRLGQEQATADESKATP